MIKNNPFVNYSSSSVPAMKFSNSFGFIEKETHKFRQNMFTSYLFRSGAFFQLLNQHVRQSIDDVVDRAKRRSLYCVISFFSVI